MPNKCCVRRCISGQEKYRTVDTQIHLFKLPSSKDEPERRKTWIDALLFLIQMIQDLILCLNLEQWQKR